MIAIQTPRLTAVAATPIVTPRQTAVPATPPPAGSGSRSNPYAIGTGFTVGDYAVAVVSVDLDAWDVIRRENQFNDPPEAGDQYVMFKLAVTYNGVDKGDPYFDIYWEIVGSGGNTFDGYCGSLPDNINDVGNLYPGASAQGNACVSASADQLAGGVLLLRSLGDDNGSFVALE